MAILRAGASEGLQCVHVSVRMRVRGWVCVCGGVARLEDTPFTNTDSCNGRQRRAGGTRGRCPLEPPSSVGCREERKVCVCVCVCGTMRDQANGTERRTCAHVHTRLSPHPFCCCAASTEGGIQKRGGSPQSASLMTKVNRLRHTPSPLRHTGGVPPFRFLPQVMRPLTILSSFQ